MRPQKSGVVLLAFVISVLVATIAVAKAPRGFAVRTDLPRAPAFWLAVGAVAQDPAGVEASLGLDRPTRRLIQQGLRNEGFDPGAPDGLFGPRTRTAIRRWQEARGVRPTGYLGSAEVELLRAAALPVPPVVQPQSPPDGAAPTSRPPAAELSADSSSPPMSCEDWNTDAFFQNAPASAVTACLVAGADPEARDDDHVTPLTRTDNGRTPLHQAAAHTTSPAVIEALLAAGADRETRTDDGRTLLHLASRNNENPAVVEALLVAGADVNAQSDSGRTPLHQAAASNKNRGWHNFLDERWGESPLEYPPGVPPHKKRWGPSQKVGAGSYKAG